MKRVLLVSYTFPPVGGAGVQRAAKFTKYLPLNGWQVSVLTAANPSVPLFDESLCAEIPATTHIERAKTWEPPYQLKAKVGAGQEKHSRVSVGRAVKTLIRSTANVILQPDPQILWAPNAIRSGRELLRDVPHEAVLATGPPFSSFIIGSRISNRFRLPLVLDYRDEWDISNAHWENRVGRGITARWQQRLQAKLLRNASAVLATTQGSAEQLRTVVRRAGGSASVYCVYNGYDPEDFIARPTRTPRTKTRVTYVGTLWGLTSIEPLVNAVIRLEQFDPLAVGRLELVVAGRRTRDQDAILQRLDNSSCLVTRHDYIPHKEAIGLMLDSDRLCTLLTDTPDAVRVVPAKLFEYLATERPMLTIAPKGEVWSILQHHSDSALHVPSDIDGIAKTLQRMTQPDANGEIQFSRPNAAAFSRVAQTAEVAKVLDSVSGQT